MRKMGLVVLLLLTLVGCQKNSELLSEKDPKDMNPDIKAFIRRIEPINGIYLFSRVGETPYLILNNGVVYQDEAAGYYSSVSAEVLDKKLQIELKEDSTTDYTDKRLGKLRIFKVNDSANIESIEVTKNGKGVPFDSVGG